MNFPPLTLQSKQAPLYSNTDFNHDVNITSIIDSFNNGTISGTHVKKLGPLFNIATVLEKLDDILLWIDSEFTACMLNVIRNCKEKQEFKECLNKTELIKKKITSLSEDFKVQSSKKFKNYEFLCKESSYEITPLDNSCVLDMWRYLEHRHLEEALALALTNNKKEFFSNTMTSVGIPILGIKNSSEKNDQTKNKDTCDHCSAQIINDFKFDFSICYDTKIEEALYVRRNFKHFRDLHGLGVPIIQFKAPQLFTCLLCCCDVPATVTCRVVDEHVRGQRHRKRLDTPQSIDLMLAYHNYWMRQEPMYQAHQSFFIPRTVTSALCVLCNPTDVPYDFLLEHINNKIHKEWFCYRYSNNSSGNTSLLNLQAEVYFGNPCIDTEKTSNSQMDSLRTNTTTNLNNIKTVNSEINQMENNHKSAVVCDISNTSPKLHTLVSRLTLDNPTTSKAETNDQSNHHIIIKSVNNELGTSLTDLLEHRFLPHLNFLTEVDDLTLECRRCQMRFGNSVDIVRNHLCSKAHNMKANWTSVKYRFYCEICNLSLMKNDNWRDHMQQVKHVERCEKLGTSRKANLTEYECKTCKLIIFGDELSIKRHMMLNGKNARHRKNKEIILCPQVIDLFKSHEHIHAKCLELVQEANRVLADEQSVWTCLRALEAALSGMYPNCRAYPFGSRVSGLGNFRSDLDVFVDVGDMYRGNIHQDPKSQEKFVQNACKTFRKLKDDFDDVNAIPTARTPIVQVFHRLSKLDCDLSFRHGLSVENTKFLRMCQQLQPNMQSLILILKQWTKQCRLEDEHITTYSVAMMVIFYLQVNDLLMPVYVLRELKPEQVFVIDGWGVIDFFSTINYCRENIIQFPGTIIEMLKNFFSYYASFNYTTDVVCPLMGRPLKKALFLDKPTGEDLPPAMLAYVRRLNNSEDAEYFRARSPFCIQDPFDLSHNIVKACTVTTVEKLKRLCDLTYKHLASIS